MEQEYNFETAAPNEALIVSYIIKLMNRSSVAQVDRLLKSNYDEIKRNPLILDTILRAQLLSFFAESGALDASRQLIRYYRQHDMFSSLLDVKNLLVISSKEGIDKSDNPLNPSMVMVIRKFIELGKIHILVSHVKSIVASCLLIGDLGTNLDRLLTGDLVDFPNDVEDIIRTACNECTAEIESRIQEN